MCDAETVIDVIRSVVVIIRKGKTVVRDKFFVLVMNCHVQLSGTHVKKYSTSRPTSGMVCVRSGDPGHE